MKAQAAAGLLRHRLPRPDVPADARDQAKFDGVALHPYTSQLQAADARDRRIPRRPQANHDAGKGLWITEIGWSSEPPIGEQLFAKGPRARSAQLKGAFTLLKQNQRKWQLKRIYWFSVDDQPGACNFCGGSGLFGEGFVPKPSWFAYVQVRRRQAG